MSRTNRTQSTAAQQTDLLFGLLHVGPKLLRQFIQTSRADIGLIKTLADGARASGECALLPDACLRIVHGIKGSAALFDLTLYVQAAHKFEEELQVLKSSKKLTSDKCLAVINEYIGFLESELDRTASLLEPLVWLKNISGEHISRSRAFLTGASLLVEELAQQHKVNAALHYAHFDLELLTDEHYQIFIDVATQLIRNAIAHGIETPDRRTQSGKPESGRIYLAARHDASGDFRFSLQDDGAGVDIEKLKAFLRAKHPCALKDNMSHVDIAACLFDAGVSTAKEQTESSGRGIGLDLVKRKIESVGGRLEFRFTQGRGCRFDIFLPLTEMRDVITGQALETVYIEEVDTLVLPDENETALPASHGLEGLPTGVMPVPVFRNSRKRKFRLLREAKERIQGVLLDMEAWNVLWQVDGRRTVDEIATNLAMSVDEVMYHIECLRLMGIVCATDAIYLPDFIQEKTTKSAAGQKRRRDDG